MVRYDGRENPKKDDIGKTWQNLITEGYQRGNEIFMNNSVSNKN